MQQNNRYVTMLLQQGIHSLVLPALSNIPLCLQRHNYERSSIVSLHMLQPERMKTLLSAYEICIDCIHKSKQSDLIHRGSINNYHLAVSYSIDVVTGAKDAAAVGNNRLLFHLVQGLRDNR